MIVRLLLCNYFVHAGVLILAHEMLSGWFASIWELVGSIRSFSQPFGGG